MRSSCFAVLPCSEREDSVFFSKLREIQAKTSQKRSSWLPCEIAYAKKEAPILGRVLWGAYKSGKTKQKRLPNINPFQNFPSAYRRNGETSWQKKKSLIICGSSKRYPPMVPAFEALKDIYTKEERWEDLAKLYEDRAERLPRSFTKLRPCISKPQPCASTKSKTWKAPSKTSPKFWNKAPAIATL